MITKEVSKPVVLDKFKGLFSRGLMDSVPEDYQITSNNTQYKDDEIFTRWGFSSIFTRASIRRFASFRRVGENPRFLILTTGGDFYDSLSPSTPLLSNVNYLDFSMVNFYNRAYITFHNRVNGITGTKVYVYEGGGPGTLRLAGGTAPSGFTITATTSATAGDIEVGIHLIAVAFESSSGFISAPGPEVFTEYNAPGGFKLDLSGVAAGPSGTVARRILATKSISPTDYNGNQFGLEFFFVPGGRIGDNTTTTVSGLNFFDDDLVDSADYLFDNLSTIPAGCFIASYGQRMVVGGISGSEHIVYFSEIGQPEVFNSISGFVTLSPGESLAGVRNGVEFRGDFFIMKPNHTYATRDNGGPPNTWGTPIPIDQSVGTECFGISTMLDIKGANTDRYAIADKAGLYWFEGGIFRKPEGSWNIESYWKRINKIHFNKVSVAINSEQTTIYIGVPLDSATEMSHIFVGNYAGAYDNYGNIASKSIRWSIWTLPTTVSCLLIDTDINDRESKLRLSLVNNIYQQDDALTSDDVDGGTAISWDFTTYLVPIALGMINHYSYVKSRIIGVGNLDITISGQDDIAPQTLTNAWVLSTTSGADKFRQIDLINEKLKVKFAQSGGVGEYARVSHIIVEGQPLWESRPNG